MGFIKVKSCLIRADDRLINNVGLGWLRRTYNLNCKTFEPGKSFMQGVQELIDEGNVKAIILGTRRGDPNGAEQVISCQGMYQSYCVQHVYCAHDAQPLPPSDCSALRFVRITLAACRRHLVQAALVGPFSCALTRL